MRSKTIIVILITVGVGLFVVGLSLSRGQSNNDLPRTAVVSIQSVSQEVTFTGRLLAEQKASLGFERTGSIANIDVRVGDHVTLGQSLVSLDSSGESFELAKARADLASAQESAKRKWEAAEKERDNVRAEQAQTVAKRRQAVIDARVELTQAENITQKTEDESGDDSATAATAKKNDLTARSTYNAAQEVLTEARKSADKLNDAAKDSAAVARANYVATLQAAVGVAGLSSLEASQGIASVRLSRGTLKAPFAGVVTQIHHEIGDIVVGGTPVVIIQNLDKMEIKADVPETDALKIRTGMTGTVTFDALPATDQFAVEVSRIAPAADIIEGVPTYEVTLQLLTSDERLKAGLTTNVSVHAGLRESVISIPRRAVVVQGKRQFVRVLNESNKIVERDVEIGLIGSDGTVEVLTGLTEDERVLIESP